MSLFRKMLRDFKINKTQFIAIFLMAFIGIFAYCGIYAEYYGLEQTSADYYAQTNLADGWVYNDTVDDSSVDKISEFTTQTDRQAVVQSQANVVNKPDMTLHFVENGTISKFYSVEGDDFNASDDSGVWLDKRFADARDLHVGDKISFEFDNQTVKKEIRGIGYSPEYVYETSPASLTPDFSQMGFAYLSANAYPKDLEYDRLLVKYDLLDDDFKEKLDASSSYLSYSFFPVLAGSILGLVTGPVIIPQMFYPSMQTNYSMPSWNPGFDMSFVYIAAMMVILSLFVTYLSCRRISKENPANTMRPKAPNMSSKGLLEKSNLWNRLSFNFRWNWRDARVNKFRAFMTIVGVMGCVALLIAAFGMNDSMKELKSWEYDDISHYESKLQISNNANPMELYYALNESNGSFIMQQSIEIKTNDSEDTVALLVSNNTDLISYTDSDRNSIDIDEGDVSISKKLSKKFNLSIGDSIRWHIVGSDDWVSSKIDQIHAEPISQGLIMSPDTLEDQGLNFTPTSILTDQKYGENIDSIKSVTTLDDLKESWDQMTNAVMMMVYVITIVAVVLAFLVLYNLGILSFTEMEREIATLKVLGFKTNFLRKILLTQNIIFTSIGFILGIPLGFYFMTLMMNAAGDSLYYIPTLTWGNILLSALITFSLSIAVNTLFSDKINDLDMVEALKDVD